MNKIQIFCDMDGVLVNFEKGVVDYINSDLQDDSRIPSNLKTDLETLRKKLLSLGRKIQIDVADLTRDPQKKIMKTQVELQIEWNLRRRIKRLELQANLQKDLGNLGRADILFMKIKKLKNKLK